VDDLENDEAVRNSESIAKVKHWLNGALLPTLDPKRNDFIMVGTILHHDAVLAQLLDPKFSDIYLQRVYRAYEPGADGKPKPGTFLWPERFTVEKLAAERRRLGTLAFNSEFLNNPIDPETRRFRPEWVRWYTGKDIAYDRGNWYFQGRKLKIIQAVDPAIKEREQDNSDFFAHVTIGVTDEGNITKRCIVVLYPYQDRLDFPQQVQRVIQQANAYPQVEKIGIEAVAYQAALRQQLLLQELLPIYEIKHDRGKSDKKARITASGVFFENGQVFLRAADESEAGELDELQLVRVHHQFRELYDALMRYPLIAHDDLLDALEMCISLAKRHQALDDFNPVQPAPSSPHTSAFGPVGEMTGHPPFLDANLQLQAPFLPRTESLGW
jgi:phage terminase large subunit-like protein